MINSKIGTGLFIIAFGVIMLLLRPFAVYHITLKDRLNHNPGKTRSMLQRVVKKKDEHHEVDASAVVMENAGRTVVRFIKPALLVLAAFFISAFKVANVKWSSLAVFKTPVNRYRYRLLSCLLI